MVVLQSVLGMSEASARNWFNGEETNELSIAQLVTDIKEYVDGKGRDFRLLFMIDEVGQYIGDDGDLMINLQSLVEEIGTKCMGKVWVGTIGLILFSMGQNIGINLGLLMGAILGGARFGASFSPISDTVNISVLLSGVRDVSLHIRSMLAVLAPAAGACSLIYLCIDSCSVRVIEDTKLIDLSELIAEEFYLCRAPCERH